MAGSKTDEQKSLTPEQLLDLMRQQIAYELLGLAAAFNVQVREAEVAKIIDFLVAEQKMIVEEILPSMTDEKQYKDSPVIGLRVWYKNKRAEMIQPMTRKRPELAGADPRAIFDFIAVMGVLLSPAVRGLLALHGFRWELFQGKVGDKPRIIA